MYMYLSFFFQVNALLRVASLSDHLFILNHLLRSPSNVSRWGVKFLHPLSPLKHEGSLRPTLSGGTVHVQCTYIVLPYLEVLYMYSIVLPYQEVLYMYSIVLPYQEVLYMYSVTLSGGTVHVYTHVV